MARFAEDHPVVVALNRQRKEVEDEINEITARIKNVPTLEENEARLTREIQLNTDRYTAMSNMAQQAKLQSASQGSNVRMIDTPVTPEKPIGPDSLLVIATFMVTGIFLGIATVLARMALNNGIHDPVKIEQVLNARVVYATIPHSVSQDKLMRRARRDTYFVPLLTQAMPDDPAIESLRRFRTALISSMPHFESNIVKVIGPTRNIGKSFVSANLAAVVASSGKRVLLIDSDLRNGNLHHHFGLARAPGLSEIISGTIQAEKVIHHHVTDQHDFIATGSLPSNCSELLLHLNFENLLETLRRRYDLVLIDTSPILDVADALNTGAHAGSVFIVARAGITTEDEINESIKQLNYAGISPQGILFNDMLPRLGQTSIVSRHGNSPTLDLAG